MNLKPITFSTVAVEGKTELVWIGLPELGRSMNVGIEREDGSIWTGYSSYELEEKDWPNFITAWYTAQVYAEALERCTGLDSWNRLLSKCPSILKLKKLPYEKENTAFVINFLPNKKKYIKGVLASKPPIEYIKQVVSEGEKLGILFEIDLLRSFLTENYQDIPDSLWEDLKKYELWRKKLASY